MTPEYHPGDYVRTWVVPWQCMLIARMTGRYWLAIDDNLTSLAIHESEITGRTYGPARYAQ